MQRWMSLAVVGLCILSVTAAAAEPVCPRDGDRAPTDGRSFAGPMRDGPLLPLPLWLVVGLGYISITLKDQLRRRGHSAAPRGRTFDDLITLSGADPQSPSADPERQLPSRKAE
jgi:hypothetical protein